MVNADMRALGELFKGIQTALENVNCTLNDINKTLQLQRNVGGDACYVPKLPEEEEKDPEVVRLHSVEFMPYYESKECKMCGCIIYYPAETKGARILDGTGIICVCCADKLRHDPDIIVEEDPRELH